MSNPTLLQMPLAVNGDKNTIPVETGSNTGLFSQKYGFQSINSLPLSAGGKAISRHDYNGAMYLLSNILFYAQKGYTFEFDSTQDYFAGCEVIDPADGNKYRCIADVAAEGDSPSEDMTHWERIFNESAFFYRMPNTTYTVGDVKYAANLPSWGFLTCITGGVAGSGELVIPTGAKAGDTITDGQVVWRLDSLANMKKALAEATGFGIVSGYAPSISGLTVTLGAGIVHIADGTRKEISASDITLDSADPTNPRIDLVYIDSTGEVAKITGTASASPVAPTLPTGGISVCNVTIAAGATTGTVTDKRYYINSGLIFTESDFEKYHDYPYLRLMNDIEITKPIVFPDAPHKAQIIDLAGNKITLANNYSAEYIFPLGLNLTQKNKKGWVLRDGEIECNHADCSVFRINDPAGINIENIFVTNNVRGLFSYVETPSLGNYGGGVIMRNVVIEHSWQDNNYRCGCDVAFFDSYLENVAPVFFSVGLRVRASDNTLVFCHPWGEPRLEDNRYPDSSMMNTGFELLSAGNALIGCCADSPEPKDATQPASYSNGGIGFYTASSQIAIVAPRVIIHEQTNNSNHIDYYYSNTATAGWTGCLYDNALIAPQVHKSRGAATPHKSQAIHMDLPNVHIVAPTWEQENILSEALTIDSKYEFRLNDSALYRDGNHIYGTLCVHRKDGVIPSSTEKVADFNTGYAPSQYKHMSPCGLAASEWAINAIGTTYISTYIGVADTARIGNIHFAYMDIDYIINTTKSIS